MPTEIEILEEKFDTAKEWCKNTRDILKIKTSWYKKDVKGDEYETLKTMTNKVTKRLENLKGNEAYKDLLKEFVEQTKMLKEAKGSENKGLATSLLNKLTILDLKIDVVESKALPEVVEKRSTKVNEQGKQEFQKQLLVAQQTLVLLKSLENTAANQTHSFEGNVAALIHNAQYLFDKQMLESALLELGKIQKVREGQELNYQAYLKYAKKIEEAESQQSKLRCLEPIKTQSLSGIILEANQLAGQKQYTEAYKKLKKVDSEYSSVKSKLSEEDKKKLSDFAEKRQVFENLHDNLLKQIQLLSSSRAMEHDAISLTKAIKDLDLIKKDFDDSIGPSSIQRQLEALNGVQKLIHQADQEKDSNKEKSKANLEAMSKYLEKRHKAEYALERMNLLFGVEAEKKQLQQLMVNAENQLKRKGELVFGYVEALEVISGYKDIVKSATEKSLQHCTKDLPDQVKSAIEEVEKRIGELQDDSILSSVEAAYFQETLQGLISKVDEETYLPTKENEKSKSEKPGLLNRVIEIGDRLNLRAQELRENKKLAEESIDQCKNLFEQLQKEGVPGHLLASSKMLYGSAILASKECDFSKAIFDAASASKLANEVSNHHNTNKVRWKEVEQKLAKYIEFANGVIGLPFFETSVRELKSESQEVLRVFESTGDYEKALKLFDDSKLEKAFEIDSMGLPPENVRKWLDQASKGINQEVKNIWSNPKITAYEKNQPRWFEYIKSTVGAEIATCQNKWRSFVALASPNENRDQLTESQINQRAEVIKEELLEIAQRWSEPKNIEKLLKKYKIHVKSSEPQQETISPELVSELVSQVLDKSLATQFGNELKTLREGNATKEEYKSLFEAVNAQIKKEEENNRKRTEQADKTRKEVQKLLEQIKGRHKNFQGYQEKLEAELADIELMIASGDMDILEMAEQKLQLTQVKISEVHHKKRDKNAVRFGDVETLWTELHKTLGEHNFVPIRLPETHQKLLKELQEAEMLAKKSSPEQGLKLLEPLRAPIREAREKAGKLNDDHERYKQERRDFENEIEEARKKTGSYYSDRVISLRDYINSRLKEGETLRHTENGLPDAFKLLHELRKMVREIMSTPESEGGPEGKIRELDAKYYKEQLEIREMARQFEIKAEDFKGPYLKNIKKTIELNANASGVSKEDLKDMLGMVDSLAKQADSAIQLVKPYIASIQHVPHKTIGQDPGPDKEKAKKDFKAAESVLSEGRLTAERLTRSTATTNVLIAANRKDVEKFWINQVNQFGAAIEETIKLIDTFKSDLPKDDPNIASCEPAKELLLSAKRQFSISAFSAPLKVLTDIPRPPVEKRLAAREEALKTMRQYREALLHDPILRKLTDEINPLNQKKLLVAFGNVRVALKRIELESLIGV